MDLRPNWNAWATEESLSSQSGVPFAYLPLRMWPSDQVSYIPALAQS